MNFQPRFIYRGNAFAIGGLIQRPKLTEFSIVAPSSLPTVGGVSAAEEQGRSFEGVLGFSSARTSARGGEKRAQMTEVLSAVQGLNVQDRLLVETVTMGLRSHEKPGDEQPSIVPEQTQISGMSIDGCQVEIVLDTTPFRLAPTKQQLQADYTDRRKGWKQKYQDRFHHRNVVRHTRLTEWKHGLIFATICESITIRHCEESCKRHKGRIAVNENSIKIPDFGTVFVGELIISDSYRRLSGLRLALGSPVRGSAEICGVESNGSGAP